MTVRGEYVEIGAILLGAVGDGECVATASIESFRPRIAIGDYGVRVTDF